ncbi:hypothetical protein BKI52_07170 [marine bacterium AO1-C]|nr:hypothetical protein BKI52_07170 [marine bacterium AO1-C]
MRTVIQQSITEFEKSDQGNYAYLYNDNLPIPAEVVFRPLSLLPAIIYQIILFLAALFPIIALIQGFNGRPELFVVAVFLSIPFWVVLRLTLKDTRMRRKIKEGKQRDGLYATGDALILQKSGKVTFFPYEVIQTLKQVRQRGNNSTHYCTLNIEYLEGNNVKTHLLIDSKKFDPKNVDSNFDALFEAIQGNVNFELVVNK